jgi:branched-chain amino acid transport system ATP-binding protein
VIAVENVSARIGAIQVLEGVSLNVRQGELAAVIGANGAGKTSLLRTISNLIPARAGRIAFNGGDTTGLSPHALARSGLVQVPQGRQIVPSLSVLDNLLIGARNVPGLRPEEVAEQLEAEFVRFPVLRERQHIPGGALSGGEQQMLAVSRALMMKPKALMLDEPSLGLAPQIVQRILLALRSLAEAGLAVLLVEQMAMLALGVADTVYVLRNGRLVLSGSAAELRRDRALIETYLS